jgi:enoyl-CoA hydratase/carnithine racemase
MTAEEGLAWGFFNRLVPAAALEDEALALARRIVEGPALLTYRAAWTRTPAPRG